MTGRGASPFGRLGLLALLVVGFAVFLAILYFIATGNTGATNTNDGRAHAASKGLNGYSALVELIEADGFAVKKSRGTSALDTYDLLILTPPRYSDPEELAAIIERREYRGPTLVILPKWNSIPSRFIARRVEPEKIKDGWVVLGSATAPLWAQAEDGVLALDLERGGTKEQSEEAEAGKEQAFELRDARAASGQGTGQNTGRPDVTENPQAFSTLYPLTSITGTLPTSLGFYSKPAPQRKPIITDQAGRMIAFSYETDSSYDDPSELEADDYEPSNWLVFVVEPDLMNNWGLADEKRAMAALTLVRNMGWGDFDAVVFDLTLNGFGGTINLLTLAFQPPFVAATICLVLAVLIIGWRAFLRFGPPAARERETAFGKSRLVTNGADLILRAGRLSLLIEPYIALSAKRTARAFGLAKPEPDLIDAAVAARQPGEPSFTARCNDLRKASKPSDILRAARALNDQTHGPRTDNRARADNSESHQE
ncbi:MAG: DUF4350 domain-containing protein [Pseudomonadota bacterium]